MLSTNSSASEPAAQKISLSLDTTSPRDFEPDSSALALCSSLTDFADAYGSDKGSIKHNYTRWYEHYLAHLKREFFSLAEIGVACGASLKMWSTYFPNATIDGFDIRPETEVLAAGYPNINITVSDCTKAQFEKFYDVIIDDGSHVSADILDAFNLQFSRLKPGGFYFIEDTFCTFNPRYPALLPFDVPKERFDRTWYITLVDALLRDLDSNPKSVIESINFHPQLAVIRRKRDDHQ
jgi:hypothetical protein